MGIQKYRIDGEDTLEANGSIRCYTKWIGGRTTAAIRNCPCGEYGTRTAYITGECDTYFSQPAAINVKGKRIKGWISCDKDDGGFVFHPEKPD